MVRLVDFRGQAGGCGSLGPGPAGPRTWAWDGGGGGWGINVPPHNIRLWRIVTFINNVSRKMLNCTSKGGLDASLP